MSSRSETALSKFSEGYNCAQSVLYSFTDHLPFDYNTGLKLACGFGAGMGRKEEVCGAVSGGILVLGAKFGRGATDDPSATEATYAKTRELMNAFRAKRGSVLCRDLLGGIELTDDEGQRRYKENDMANRVCKPCVRSAVEILERLLQEAEPSPDEGHSSDTSA